MAIGIHGYNLVSVTPLGERTNLHGRVGVGEIRTLLFSFLVLSSPGATPDKPMIRVQFFASNRQGVVDRI